MRDLSIIWQDFFSILEVYFAVLPCVSTPFQMKTEEVSGSEIFLTFRTAPSFALSGAAILTVRRSVPQRNCVCAEEVAGSWRVWC